MDTLNSSHQKGGADRKRRTYDSYSLTIAPVPYSKRTVSSRSMIAVWFSMAVQLAIFMNAGQMFPSLTVSQILFALLIGNTFTAFIILLIQDMGIRYGIPFSVAARSAFGFKGTLVPALMRAFPALFWYGFQTWIGASALNEVVKIVVGYDKLMLWIILFGVLQIITTFYGMNFVKIMNTVAAPIMFIMGIWLIYIMLDSSSCTLGQVMKMGGDGSGISFGGACASFAAGLLPVAISIQDIIKDCKTSKADSETWGKQNFEYMITQWIGMVPTCCMFGIIGAISMALAGEWNPIIAISKVVGNISPLMTIVCQLFILLATWTTNAAQNLINPAYTICALFKRISWKKGVIIAGILGLSMQAWNAADSITTVLSIIGTMLGPIGGIMICDYFLIRKRKLSLGDLYDSKGMYQYWNGINWGAILTLIVSIIVSMLISREYMSVIGLTLSIAIYYLLMKVWVLKKHPVDLDYVEENDQFLYEEALKKEER